MPDLAESSTQGQKDAFNTDAESDKENSFHLLGLTQDIGEGGDLSDASPPEEDAAAQEPGEQEEEWEDEDDGEGNEGQFLFLFVCVCFILSR